MTPLRFSVRRQKHCLYHWLVGVGCLASAFVAAGAPPAPPPPIALSLLSLYSFPSNQSPQGGLVIGGNGNFYVTASGATTNSRGVTNGLGNPNSYGAVFEVTPQGALTNSISFQLTNGAAPFAPLTQGGDGYLYGTTSGGGFANNGTIFKVSPALNSIVTLVRFNNTNGSQPYAPLLAANNGLFYGTTFSGGTNGFGTVFEMNSLGALRTLNSFDWTNGANPYSGLIQAKNGNLYGTTRYGGTNGQGTIFVISPNGATFATLVSFDGANGSDPRGLAQGSDTNFYGVTFSGGTNDLGTLFRMTPSGFLTTLASFNIPNAANPDGPLIQASDGAFYGTTLQGGLHGLGTVFQFFPNSRPSNPGGASFSLGSVSFTRPDGAHPSGGLIQDTNGNLFGTAFYGGASGSGTIFELTGFAPAAATQPVSQSFVPGGTTTFFVPTTGSAPLSYQWIFNGVPLINGANISGADTPTLVISSEAVPDVGTYSVIISNPYGAITNTTELSVPGPIVTVKPPPPSSTTSAILAISGTTSDRLGVSTVDYQLGTNVAVANTTDHWTNWSASLTLQPGSNVLQVWTVDQAGNSSRTNTYNILYYVTDALTLGVIGSGKIVTPPGFNPARLLIGNTYAVTAVPAAGNLFSNWTGSLASPARRLTFVMASNMTLTANFVTNVFKPAAGVYSGLFYEQTNAITRGAAGLLNALTISSRGAYSGRLLLGGASYIVSGAFNLAGAATSTITRNANLGGPVTLAMSLDWTTTPPTLDGVVSALATNTPQWTAELTTAPKAASRASADYTILLEPARDASAGPPGVGYALVANHQGAASIVGALPDGTAFAQTVSVSDAGSLPLYASLYGGAGLLVGWITNLNDGAPTGDLVWIAPPNASRLYPGGFTNMLAAQGSLWTNPPPRTAAISLDAGQLAISGGFLAAPLVYTVSVNTSDALAVLSPSATNSLRGSINAKTGLLTLTFGNGNGNGKAVTAARGAILQNQSTGAGFFTTKTNAGSISLQP